MRAYAEKAGGTVGGPAFVHLTHHASLATDRNRPPMTIEADQWLSSYRPEFVWHGKGAMFGLPVAVVDSFVGGSGLLEARLLGTVAVAKGVGAAFDRGELQRYLSELPLHPDAILNNDALTWRQVDERTVEVSGNTAGGTASVQFFFDEAGDIAGMLAAGPADDGGAGDGADAVAGHVWRVSPVRGLPHPDAGRSELGAAGGGVHLLARRGDGVRACQLGAPPHPFARRVNSIGPYSTQNSVNASSQHPPLSSRSRW